jgi:hypothetical protein
MGVLTNREDEMDSQLSMPSTSGVPADPEFDSGDLILSMVLFPRRSCMLDKLTLRR